MSRTKMVALLFLVSELLPFDKFLAHLSQRLMMSYCDRLPSVRP